MGGLKRRFLAARHADEQGSLAIELVAFVPIVVITVILLIQGFLAVGALATAQQAANDGARAQMRGESASAAVAERVPGWLTLQQVRTGNAAAAGCPGSCVSVEIRVPIGFPGWTNENLTMSRTAQFPAE